MEITEDQRRRAEANRLAALEKRKRLAAAPAEDAWRLQKCPKIPTPLPAAVTPATKDAVWFRIVLEICSPDEFSVAPQPLQGSQFPGDVECLRNIEARLSPAIPLRAIEGQDGRRTSVFKLKDYEFVLKCLKKSPGVELQEIPFITRTVVQKLSLCVGDQWAPDPGLPGFYSDEMVDEYLKRLPKLLRDALLPFQLEGVRFGLRRGGRCIIADEMGLGKTIQAIAIACCFMDHGPVLVICPAVLRFSWAEELEHWLPFLLPKDIHLVFGHRHNLDHLERSPKVVVISYKMLNRLRKSMLEREWTLVIVDESHNIRCTKKKSESEETKTVIDVASRTPHVVLLSGTPSLSRPYDIYHQINILWPRLLGKDKYEFAKNYCSLRLAKGCQGKIYKDFSRGIRLEELNVLLRQTLMIRRLKEHVLTQLPPKRRQIIRLMLKATDILLATTSCRSHDQVCMQGNLENEVDSNYCEVDTSFCFNQIDQEEKLQYISPRQEKDCRKRSRHLSIQEIGIAKLSGFRDWFSSVEIIRGSEDGSSLNLDHCQKMVIFAHHRKVLDGIQEFICEKGIQFVRIDGSTLPRDRQEAVEVFRSSVEVKIAIIGITAGGVGLDFSSAQNVVFLELPKSSSEMLQAEDRAHRRGQSNAVNIYIFCAKDSLDESHWFHLNKSLFRVSSMMNGNGDAIKEIEVEKVLCLDYYGNSFHDGTNNLKNGNSDKFNTEAIKVYSHTGDECEGSGTKNDAASIYYPKQGGPFNSEVKFFSLVSVSNMEEGYSVADENVKITYPEKMHIGQCNSASICTIDEGNERFDCSQEILVKVDKRHVVLPLDTDCRNDLVGANTNSSNQEESLRFEVSQYTKRIHLYICVRGTDARPRPLFESFRPEELNAIISSAGDIKVETTPQILKENTNYRKIFQEFIEQWNALRPIEQLKLIGKPLQLPLSLELCYLMDTIKHGCGGLQKGGSKRRITPMSDISCPLPENATWKKVALSGGHGKEKEYTQAWTVSDEPLCKLCQQPCNGKLAKAPEFFEDLFCNFSCFQEYRIRTSQRSLRQALFQIEHGVCAQCKLDCHKLVKCIKPLSVKSRREYIEKVAPKLAGRKKLLDKLVNEPTEGNAWHADHIVAVSKGGGECGIENMRTLCVFCHYEVTSDQRAVWRSERKKAKQRVKITRKEVEGGGNVKRTDPTVNLSQQRGAGEGSANHEGLFVTVPGSAYSTTVTECSDNWET